MFCNQHHLDYSGNKILSRNVSNITYQSLVLSLLLSISFVMDVTDIYHPYVVILALRELDHLFLSYLVKPIHVQSIHTLVILILSYSDGFYHQHQPSPV
jgi:hypothetical protein